MHTEFSNRDKIVFEGFSENELDIIIRFAKQYDLHLSNKIKELGINSKTGGFEKL